MTTIQIPQALAHQATAPAPVRAVPVCGCGQDLDSCHGQHCPRCGRTLFGHPVAMIPAA